MIVAEELIKDFEEFRAVDGVSIHVPAGQVLALLGPNGAGKTTTVRMLSSILPPTSGRASIAGFDVVSQAVHVRSKVGVLSEQQGLYGRMNAGEYLEFFGNLYGIERQVCRQRIKQLLNQFDLEWAHKKRLGEYSRGMRQKLALVRALLHQPPVLLLDEPTSAMDPESARMVRDSIYKLRCDERAIILCTHNLAEAEELSDQVAIIRRGKIILSGSLNEIKRKLLGEQEFEAQLSQPLNHWNGILPQGVQLTGRGENWLRFHVDHPDEQNPQLLNMLLESGLSVRSFQETTHSLEKAYLEAVNHIEDKP